MAVINDDTISSGTVSWNNTNTTSDANADWKYYSPQDYDIRIEGDMSISGKISSKQWEELEEEVKKLKEANKMAQMGLYEVAAVNTKTNKVFYGRFVAKNSGSAERKLIKKYPEIDEWDEDYLKIQQLWSFEWKTEKPKEVKIVKE